MTISWSSASRVDASIFALFGFEIEAGKADFLLPDKAEQVLVEEWKVNRLNVLVVRLSIRPFGIARIAHEIVIRGQGYGAKPVDRQLGGESLGQRRLSGRGRTGDEDKLDAAPPRRNGIGDTDHLVFVQRFGDADQLFKASVRDALIELPGGGHPQDAAPFFVFLKDAEEVWLILKRRDVRRSVAIRQMKHKTRRIGDELESFEGAGGCRQRTVRKV